MCGPADLLTRVQSERAAQPSGTALRALEQDLARYVPSAGEPTLDATPARGGTPSRRPPELAAWDLTCCGLLATIADAARSWVGQAAGRTVVILLVGTGEPGRIARLIGRFVEEATKAA